MTLKQRRTPFDFLLLHVLLPLLHDSPLRPMLRLCGLWHAQIRVQSAMATAAAEPATWDAPLDPASVEADTGAPLPRAA